MFGLVAAVSALATAASHAEPPAAPTSGSTPAATPSAAPTKEELAAEAAAAKAKAREQKELRAKYGEGPYPGEVEAFIASKPATLQPFFRTLFLGGERNAVLNFDRLGLAAMQAGEWKIAEHAFDGALTRIEQVYAQNTQAEQAKSVWKKEARKDYKGEPYERAMAYYYRGLLYLRTEDYDNARASFKGALFQDSINLDGDRAQDFVLMNYLSGWASACAGDTSLADEQFQIAAKVNTNLVRPPAGTNTLFIAEIGLGPVKSKSGQNAELLEFKSVTGLPEAGAYFTASGNPAAPQIATREVASLSYQASDRDGRKMDGVLKGKAEAKAITNAVGDQMIQQSLLNNNNGMGGMMGGMLAGWMMKGLSSAMHADADIRMWDTLPDRVLLATATVSPLPSGNYSITFLDGKQAQVDLKPAALQAFGGKRCSLIWARSRDAIAVDPVTPGDDAGVAAANARRKEVQAKDKGFRASLSDF